MALSASVNWRVRAGGAETNGGGYDATVSGAGTDYSDQDSPQKSISDLVSTASTAATSAAGGLTTALIGNVLRLASAAGSPTAGYYMITAVPSATSLTLDRASGTYTAGVAKIGGAHAELKNYLVGGDLPAPALTSPLAAGHTVWIRGAGSSTPSTVDYDESAGFGAFPDGSATARIYFKGYNGKPLIGHRGLLDYGGGAASYYHTWQGIAFKQTNSTYLAFGVITPFNAPASTLSHFVAISCIFDQNGNDSVMFTETAIDCHFKNTGATTAGTAYAHPTYSFGARAIGNVYENIRGGGFNDMSGLATVEDNIVRNCKGTSSVASMVASGVYPSMIKNNTLDGGAGDGMRFESAASMQSVVLNNIVSNHAGSGKYGMNCTTGTTAQNDSSRVMWDYNNLYGNTAARNACSAGAHDVALDPQYTATGSADYSVGSNMKAIGFPATFPA